MSFLCDFTFKKSSYQGLAFLSIELNMARNVSCSQQTFLEGLTAFATSHEMILDVHGHEGSDAHLGLVFLFIFLLSEK